MGREFKLVSAPPETDTIFIGGGTPGVFSAGQLEILCELVKDSVGGCIGEWSVELAPNEITAEKLRVLRAAGVNRVSLGIQSFDAELLQELGREHPPERALQAYDLLREADFPAVNIDLMFAFPGQSLEAWERDLRRAVELAPDHLSTYCLTFEEDTALYVKLASGNLRREVEREAAFYEYAWRHLPDHGYEQYEVSNFARPGKRCLHNLNIWRMGDWYGYGPSATSQVEGRRFRNVADLDRWAEGLATAELVREQIEELTPTELARDAVLFGLRLNDGFDLGEIAERFSVEYENFAPIVAFLESLVGEGLAEGNGTHFRLKTAGRILTDAIMAELPETRESARV